MQIEKDKIDGKRERVKRSVIKMLRRYRMVEIVTYNYNLIYLIGIYKNRKKSIAPKLY